MAQRMMYLLAVAGIAFGVVGCGVQGETDSAPRLRPSAPSLSISSEEQTELPEVVKQPPNISQPPKIATPSGIAQPAAIFDAEEAEAGPKTIVGVLGDALKTGVSAGLSASEDE